jgi:hypothetical protein
VSVENINRPSVKTTIACVALILAMSASADPDLSKTFTHIVDKDGKISLPLEFHQTWAFLGTWSIAAPDVDSSGAASGHGAAGLHNVYTQSEAITAYKKTGEFPDGTVLIKELLKAKTGSMTTGTVSWGQEVEGWFVMVKDRHNRFPDHSLWGDGWGWVLFNSSAPETAVTQNYKSECLGCHIPARQNDWIYVQGYPVLNSE